MVMDCQTVYYTQQIVRQYQQENALTVTIIMWLVTITCSADAWKRYSAGFLAMADKYQGTCVSSKKTPDGKRFMEYRIEDVGEAT